MKKASQRDTKLANGLKLSQLIQLGATYPDSIGTVSLYPILKGNGRGWRPRPSASSLRLKGSRSSRLPMDQGISSLHSSATTFWRPSSAEICASWTQGGPSPQRLPQAVRTAQRHAERICLSGNPRATAEGQRPPAVPRAPCSRLW